MSTTGIHHEKDAPGVSPVTGGGRRRVRGVVTVIAAVIAIVAAGVGGAVWLVGIASDDGATTSEGPPTVEESVAQDFLTAFTGLHADRVALHLADGAAMPAGWGEDLRRYDAWNVIFLVRPCEVVSTSSSGASLTCPFDFHALGTDELDRAPFGHNSFALRVDEGKVTYFQTTFATAINGFDQYYDAVGSWVRANHPGDWAFMDADDRASAAELPRWLRLWEERLAQYEDRVAQYVDATTPG